MEDDLRTYIDSGTTVLNVNASHLKQFLRIYEVCEKNGWGTTKGIFKMKVNEEDRKTGTSINRLLSILGNKILSSVRIQEFRRYPLCRDVYGYKQLLLVDKLSAAAYKKRMLDAKTYSCGETCCSKICKESGKLQSVVDHFYESVKSNSVLRSSGKSSRTSRSVHEECQNLLEIGKAISTEYNRIMLTENHAEAASSEQKKSVSTGCNCVDCFSESDSESESQDERSPRQQEKCSETYPKYSAGMQLSHNSVKIVKQFGLSDVFSVLNMLPHTYAGLNLPYFYVGEEHSSFAAHSEDNYLPAANYLHAGFPKCWISIPPDYHHTVVSRLQEEIMELAHTSCRNSLSHKFYMLTLDFLRRHGIPYHITFQYPGEFVVLYPKTIHFGFNTGPNIAEAINFASKSWIKVGVESMKNRCRCYGDSSVHIDMKPLVAAFYPHELQSLFGLDPPAAELSELPQVQAKKKVKIFECPGCDASYNDHRGRLISHVQSKHSPDLTGYMEEIEKKYPKSERVSSSGIVCSVCSDVLSGSVSHLERHMVAQIQNRKLTNDVRKQYEEALLRLQGQIKRRKVSKNSSCVHK